MSKGSRQRPCLIKDADLLRRWRETFGTDERKRSRDEAIKQHVDDSGLDEFAIPGVGKYDMPV
jgi:hypothetical protein